METTTRPDTFANFVTGINDALTNDVDRDGAIFIGYPEGVDYARSAEFEADLDAAAVAFESYFPANN